MPNYSRRAGREDRGQAPGAESLAAFEVWRRPRVVVMAGSDLVNSAHLFGRVYSANGEFIDALRPRALAITKAGKRRKLIRKKFNFHVFLYRQARSQPSRWGGGGV